MLWVSLVWTFNFYLNLAHHTVSQTKGGEQGGHFDRAVKKNTSQPLRSLSMQVKNSPNRLFYVN